MYTCSLSVLLRPRGSYSGSLPLCHHGDAHFINFNNMCISASLLLSSQDVAGHSLRASAGFPGLLLCLCVLFCVCFHWDRKVFLLLRHWQNVRCSTEMYIYNRNFKRQNQGLRIGAGRGAGELLRFWMRRRPFHQRRLSHFCTAHTSEPRKGLVAWLASPDGHFTGAPYTQT